jgi:uracil-DNA glycosylase
VNAQIFIMLQDWASEEFLKQKGSEEIVEQGRAPMLGTNRNLDCLLLKHFEISIRDTYASNLFPFIKKGGMSEKSPRQDLAQNGPHQVPQNSRTTAFHLSARRLALVTG